MSARGYEAQSWPGMVELIRGVAMAILFVVGMWVLYLWLARKCLRMSAASVKAGGRHELKYWGSRPRVKILPTVPSEWVESYRAENDA